MQIRDLAVSHAYEAVHSLEERRLVFEEPLIITAPTVTKSVDECYVTMAVAQKEHIMLWCTTERNWRRNPDHSVDGLMKFCDQHFMRDFPLQEVIFLMDEINMRVYGEKLEGLIQREPDSTPISRVFRR